MLQELHLEYYDNLLKYVDEFQQFKDDYDPDEFIKHKGGKDSMI